MARGTDGGGRRPELSVVVPTRDRRAGVLRLLAALEPQLRGVEAEVIVVDDASSDGTADAVEAARFEGSVRVVRVRPHGGAAAAVGRGLAEAAGTWCLVLDDDLALDSGLVEEHLRVQRETGGCVAVGRIDLAPGPRRDAVAAVYAERWAVRTERLAAGAAPTVADVYSGNLSAPRDAIRAIGGIAPDVPRGWDVELGARLVRHGLPIRSLDAARAVQDFDKGWRELVRDARREGDGEVRVWRRHPWTLDRLALGAFGAGRRRVRLARKVALALRLPAGSLARLTPLVARGARRRAWFELVLGLAFWSGARATLTRDEWARLTSTTTVLMYHAFAAPGEPASRWILPARSFARQLRVLRLLRRRFLTAAELHRHRSAGEPPPPRSVVVTIDDGYTDALELAAPLLARHRVPATLYVVADALGGTNVWDPGSPLEGRPILDADGVRRAAAAGLAIGVHGATHRPLDGLPADELAAETAGARATLESVLQTELTTFAYPYGRADDPARAAVADAGFDGAFGVRDGGCWPSSPAFELRRTEVRGTDSLLRFAVAVLTGSSRTPRRRG